MQFLPFRSSSVFGSKAWPTGRQVIGFECDKLTALQLQLHPKILEQAGQTQGTLSIVGDSAELWPAFASSFSTLAGTASDHKCASTEALVIDANHLWAHFAVVMKMSTSVRSIPLFINRFSPTILLGEDSQLFGPDGPILG